MSLQYSWGLSACAPVHVWQSVLLTHLNAFGTVDFALLQKFFSLVSRALPSIVIYLPSFLFLFPNSKSALSAAPPHDFCPYPAQLLSLPSLFMSTSSMSKFPLPSVTPSFLCGQNAPPACQLSCHPSFSICRLFMCKMPGRKLGCWCSRKDKEDGRY